MQRKIENYFKDLYIEKSEYFKEQGQYPTIFITLKDTKKNNWEECYSFWFK